MNDATVQMPTLRQRFEAWVHLVASARSANRCAWNAAASTSCPPARAMPSLCCYLVLFLWSINYSNSMGFAFTFLLAAVAQNSMWQAHDNLLGLIVHPAQVAGVRRSAGAVWRAPGEPWTSAALRHCPAGAGPAAVLRRSAGQRYDAGDAGNAQ